MIQEVLSIGLLQFDIAWEDKKANLSSLKNSIQRIQSGELDLLLLPEMFNTGFSMNTQKLAEGLNGETVETLKNIAAEKNCAVAGSLIIEENDKYYNRLIFIKPDRSLESYDKRHLFSLVDEDKHLTAGKKKLIVSYKGWKINFFICYDLRFPVWCNNDSGVDLTIFVANWPAKRVHHWDALLKARAIENQSYIAAVNRIGKDGDGNEHNGHSAVYDFKGDLLTELSENQNLIIQKIEKKPLEEHRKKYPFLKDNDQFGIIID